MKRYYNMKQLLLALSVVIYNITVAQDTTFYAAVRDAINSTGNTGTIFYADTAILFWQLPSHFAKKKTLKGFEAIRSRKQTTLGLTQKELQSLDQQAKGQTRIQWKEEIIPNSKRLTKDILDTIIYNNRWRDEKKEKPVHYYYFSQPIYTRNNTLLMFHVWDMIGHSAGYTLFFVYQLEREDWKHKLVMSTGAF
jgi:hypothetical protein